MRTERQHAGGQMQCKFLSNFGEYTARMTYIVLMYVAFGMEKSLANPEADVLTSHHETPENSGADRADI